MDDDEDFGLLYLSSRRRLAAQICCLTGDRAEAADVVQEAFARAWANWGKIRGFDDREAWVRKVAFLLAVSRWRRIRHSLPMAERSRDRSPEPTDDRLDLLRALATLSTSQRQAVVLHHLAGLSTAATALEMGVPVGTVKSWLTRGRHRLAEQLGQDTDVEVREEVN